MDNRDTLSKKKKGGEGGVNEENTVSTLMQACISL